MTNQSRRKMILAEFEHLLEVHGADRTRWPLASRAEATAILKSDASARRMLAEAVALEAVLAVPQATDAAAIAALADRIVAATRRSPRLVARTDNPRPARTTGVGRVFHGLEKDVWRAGALLAASMLIGIFVGQSQLGAGAVPALVDLAGVTLGVSTDKMALADLPVEAVDDDRDLD